MFVSHTLSGNLIITKIEPLVNTKDSKYIFSINGIYAAFFSEKTFSNALYKGESVNFKIDSSISTSDNNALSEAFLHMASAIICSFIIFILPNLPTSSHVLLPLA